MKKQLNTKQVVIILLVFILIVAIAIIVMNWINKPNATEGPLPSEEETKMLFNLQFTPYENNITGTLAKVLITKVEYSNNEYSDAKFKVTLKGITEISDIEKDKNYNVTFDYNEEGHVSVITNKEK